MADLVSERYAIFPLTVFDKMFERTTFVTGWLLEGAIDNTAFATALDQVTRKWRMLSGRLESSKEGGRSEWHLKIPLDSIPPNYSTYALTTSTSTVPLSHYVSVPIPTVSASLPMSVFLHASTPRQYATWESTNHPLTCWNVIHFPAFANNGVDYTCIGFARCHGIFDGGGAAQIVKALIAEIRGEEWTPPLPLHQGINVNPIEEILAPKLLAGDFSGHIHLNADYAGYTPLDVSGTMKLTAWHLRERWWRGADRRIVLMPIAVLTHIVEDVRSALRSENRQVEHVTTGDILVAWVFKTIYSSAPDSNTPIHCTNFASFRALLADKMDSPLLFPHNAFIPLPYPVLTVGDVKSLSLPALTNLLAASRLSLSFHHVVEAYRQLQKPCFPNPPNVQDTLNVSNVSASRIVEADWTLIGSKRTLCGYRYQATPTGVLFTNAVYIAGRLDDGTVILDVTLNRERFNLLTGKLQRSAAKIGHNEDDI